MAPEHRSVLAVDAQPQRHGILPGHEGQRREGKRQPDPHRAALGSPLKPDHEDGQRCQAGQQSQRKAVADGADVVPACQHQQNQRTEHAAQRQ